MKKFEESYFEGYYKKMVGDFSPDDLEKAKRWFHGWFKTLESFIPTPRQGNKKSVLEVGCSIGGAAAIAEELGYEVYATDISKYAVKKAEKNLPNIHFFPWDVTTKFPLNKKFDLIYAFEVVEHLEDPRKAILNLKTLLKPKAILILSTPLPFKYVYNDPTHINVKRPDEWRDIIKDAGFSKITIKRRSFIPFLYRFSRVFSVALPFSVNSRYINSTIFLIAQL
jgi:SAM-dependent methyltransferase